MSEPVSIKILTSVSSSIPFIYASGGPDESHKLRAWFGAVRADEWPVSPANTRFPGVSIHGFLFQETGS